MSGVLQLLVSSATQVPPWVTISAGDWLGDTGSFTLGTGTITGNTGDMNVRMGLTIIASAQDFDFEAAGGAFGSSNGPYMGFYDNGTATGATKPTNTNAIVSIVNGGATPGYENNGDTNEGPKTAGFMASVTVRLSRRGSSYKAYLNDVLNYTWTGVTGSTAGGFYFGTGGGTNGWSFSGVRYRKGSGLP